METVLQVHNVQKYYGSKGRGMGTAMTKALDGVTVDINRVSPKEIPGRVEQVAAMLDVADVLKKYPYQMSGGQRQRIACARAIVTRPAIVLADEPTGALDSKNSRLLLGSLADLNRQGATILMVTHDSYAASWSSRVLFIKDGRIFNELSRGDESRQQFFQKIMDVVSFMGGEAADVR